MRGLIIEQVGLSFTFGVESLRENMEQARPRSTLTRVTEQLARQGKHNLRMVQKLGHEIASLSRCSLKRHSWDSRFYED